MNEHSKNTNTVGKCLDVTNVGITKYGGKFPQKGLKTKRDRGKKKHNFTLSESTVQIKDMGDIKTKEKMQIESRRV